MATKHKFEKFIEDLNSLLDYLPENFESISNKKRAKFKTDINTFAKKLTELSFQLDPIKQPELVLDPSDPFVIGQLIARTFLKSQLHKLEGLPKFYGSGVYALYYTGAFKAYKPIRNKEIPIYVGKVDPELSEARTPEEQGIKLWHRLVNDHRKNLNLVNLDVLDFNCRYLVVKSAWQNTAEKYLIHWFKPVWNYDICTGFGKHGDSGKTRGNTNSPWDTLHPGRKWAKTTKPNPKTQEEIISDILHHYDVHLATIESALDILPIR